MIQLSRNYSLPEKEEDLSIKIIGVGGAGSNALDRIVLDGMEYADLIALNTDVQSLASSVATQKVQLGRAITRGLGTGGDPELGYAAAQESADEIREVLKGARMVFVCAGLGGGTGSGAAPLVAHMAHENGALVVGFATLPFSFEGKRRGIQAEESLARLQQLSDAVVCFENDRMGDIVLPKAGIHQAFAVADVTISQSVRSIVNVIRRPGLIRIGFDDLLVALRSKNGRCLFGFGESDTDNRAHEAIARALKNPLMDRGRMLENARAVLVQVAGGPGMTLSEVEIVMQELGRHIEDHTQIIFGTAVDGKMGNRLSVTLISSLATGPEIEKDSPPATPKIVELPQALAAVPPPPAEPQPVFEPPQVATSLSEGPPSFSPTDFQPEQIPVHEEQEIIAPVPVRKERKEAPVVRKEKRVQARQEVMQFEPVTRGRFEKSEPTIVEGQDLDVPTYLRKNVR
ncbi:MAG TPA: cell division protein FtsZ, partial [Chthoniobacterales bacterium]